MADKFDPYYQWLGIPPKDQPPSHYRLLGVEEFESNSNVIEAAAERQSTYLHEVSMGPNIKESQKLLNEVAAAKICLLNAEKKAAYDAELEKQKAAKVLASVGDELTDYGASSDDLFDIEALGDFESSSDTDLGSDSANTLPLSSPSPQLAPQTKPKSKKSSIPVLWLAIGGGVAALLLVFAVVGFIIASSSTDSDEPDENENKIKDTEVIKDPPKLTAINKQPNTPQPSKAQPSKAQPSKAQPIKAQPTKAKSNNRNKKPPTAKPNTPKSQPKPKPKTKPKPKPDTTKTTATKPKTPVVASRKFADFAAVAPKKITSEKGTPFKTLSDLTVLAEGSSSTDTYTVVLETGLSAITAIRLECVTNDSLQNNGPGRWKNGSFTIAEVVVKATRIRWEDRLALPVVLGAVESADAKGVERIIDGKDHTIWVVDRGGQKTMATIRFKAPTTEVNGTKLVVFITQKSALGAFRISVTNDPKWLAK